jgi:hypothetical protein
MRDGSLLHTSIFFSWRGRGRWREGARAARARQKQNKMSAPGEIITLQFGPAANAAGTHFWNIQVRVACVCVCAGRRRGKKKTRARSASGLNGRCFPHPSQNKTIKQDELLGLEAGGVGGGTTTTAAAFESGVLWAEGRGATVRRWECFFFFPFFLATPTPCHRLSPSLSLITHAQQNKNHQPGRVALHLHPSPPHL